MGYSRVSIDYQGLHKYLWESKELELALLAHAEVGARFAKAIAPVGPPRDKHRHEFRDSIRAEPSKGPRGGIAARIVAEPVWVEFGRKHVNPYQGSHTLRRTGQFLNAPKRSA
jgi:hypothetical protein